MREILTLKPAAEARAMLDGFDAVGVEATGLDDADGRVCAEDIFASGDLPPWPRATMDGFAVRAADTAFASPTAPCALTVRGAVPMGDVWQGTVGEGDAVAISTGGVLPDGADAVVMKEWTENRADVVAVQKSVTSRDNVIHAGEDLRRGDLLISRGRRMRPQDVSALAAFGITSVSVFRRPVVGILSTGNEVVLPDKTPRPGQVRDMNQVSLGAQVRRAGSVAVLAGIAPDDAREIGAKTAALLARCDTVLLSGGSSVGVRDLTAGVFSALGAETLFHGIDIRPGKPTILARVGKKPIWGMPGIPVSAMVVFDFFVRPLLLRLAGESGCGDRFVRRRAMIARPTASPVGREDYVRVRLVSRDGEMWAEPLPGGSSAISTLVRADGVVVVPAERGGLAEGEHVDVLLY